MCTSCCTKKGTYLLYKSVLNPQPVLPIHLLLTPGHTYARPTPIFAACPESGSPVGPDSTSLADPARFRRPIPVHCAFAFNNSLREPGGQVGGDRKCLGGTAGRKIAVSLASKLHNGNVYGTTDDGESGDLYTA